VFGLFAIVAKAYTFYTAVPINQELIMAEPLQVGEFRMLRGPIGILAGSIQIIAAILLMSVAFGRLSGIPRFVVAAMIFTDLVVWWRFVRITYPKTPTWPTQSRETLLYEIQNLCLMYMTNTMCLISTIVVILNKAK
jgi:hypothetical protein